MSRTHPGLVDLSSELVLEIIQHVSFDKTTIRKLSSTHPRIRSLLRMYERSVARALAFRQLPHSKTDFPCDRFSYAWLAQCIDRYDLIDSVMALLTSNNNSYRIHKHNMALTHAGLLLLYKLSSIDMHKDKLEFLTSQALDPLKAILVLLFYSTHTARYHGHGIINQDTYKTQRLNGNQLEMRNEIEFCFAEGVMNVGPQFIFDTLFDEKTQDTALMCVYHQHALQDWDTVVPEGDFKPPITEGPHQELGPQSLYSFLLERMGEMMDCPKRDVLDLVIDDIETPGHSLAWLGPRDNVQLMRGLDVSNA